MTTSFEAGSIVVVLYPFSDMAVSRPRPALVLSDRNFNVSVGQLLIAMVTTATRSTWPEDTRIRDLEQAGLRHPSVVRMRFTTVVAERVRARLGQLSQRDRAGVAAAFARVVVL